MTKSLVRFVGGLFLIAATIGSGAAIGIGALSAEPAGAVTTYVVDNANDAAATASNCTTPVVGECTLRDALAAAAEATTDVTITLPSLGVGDVYNVESSIGQLDVSGGHTVTINGGGQSDTIIQAQCEECTVAIRVLEVDSGTTADISGVTLENGNLSGGDGGGIFDDGAMTLTDSTATDNTAGAGGGVYVEGGGGSNTFTGDSLTGNTALNDEGGGLYIDGGTNTVTGGGISNNTADDDGEGGGVFIQGGTNNFSGQSVTENEATDDSGEGGGFYVLQGTNTFSDETVNDNTATNDGQGGGFYIDDGTNTLNDDTVNDNQATDGGEGGGIYVDDGTNTFNDGTVNGNQATDSGNGGGFYVDDGTNTFTDDTVNDNDADFSGGNGQGGGFYVDAGTNTFTGDSIDGNTAYEGGGAYLDFGSNTFTQADISGNTGTESAGGLWIDSGQGEPTTITQSTISDNSAPGSIGETVFLGDGGGILSDGCNPITLTNDTIASNTAGDFGGGYFGTGCSFEPVDRQAPAGTAETAHVVAQPTTAFLFDTVSGNSATSGGGNIETNDASILTTGESIVAGGITDGSPTTNCGFTGTGTLTSLGYNLIDDSTCGTPSIGDIIGQSAQLGSLGNNGGPTQTEVPATGSPAISAIPAATCSGTGVSTDQRGNDRGAGTNGSCTIGAVEVALAAPPSFNPNGYRMVADEGGIFDFGLNFNGSLALNHLNAPIIGIANSPGPNGYLMAGSDGGVFALGGANFYGSLCCNPLPSPIAAIAATPAEDGYWLASQSGTIYHFGNTPAVPAVQVPSGAHIVGMASTNDGKGLWLTDNLGDVYAVGDALYLGGMGGIHLNAPVVGIAAAATGQGYVLVASDGGTFNFGVGFFGSVPGSLAPGQHLVAPIVGIAVTHSGKGYWMVGADGGLFNYGDAPFLGSIYTAIPGQKLNGPIVGIQHLGSAPPG